MADVRNAHRSIAAMDRRSFLLGAGTAAACMGLGVAARPYLLPDAKRKGSALGIDVRDFGVDLSGRHGSTNSFQRAVDETAESGIPLHIPEGTTVLEQPVVASRAVRMIGTGVTPALGATADTQSPRGKGSWLNLAHNGRGVIVRPEAGFIYGSEFVGLGTFRTQNAPRGSAAFTPTDCDFDFDISNASVLLDVFVANATKGIRLFNAGGSHLRSVRGQPLEMGIQVDCAYDTIRFGDVHLWPWWSQAPGVRDFMLNNATGIYLKRCDNPKFSSYFTIYRKFGLRIGHFPGEGRLPPGTTYKLEGHFEADIGIYGLYVEPESDGFTAMLANPIIQSIVLGEKPTIPIFVKGKNARIDIDQVALTNAGASAVRLEGENSVVSIGHARLANWDRVKAGHPAFMVAAQAASAGAKIRVGSGDFQGEGVVFGTGAGGNESIVPRGDVPASQGGLTIESQDDASLTFRLRGRDNQVRSGMIKLH